MSSMTILPTHGASQPWLSLELSEHRYAVPLVRVREVIRSPEITPVPGAPADVTGIISVRGGIITILDGCRRLGLARKNPPATDEARLVVFEHGDEAVAVQIDAIGDVFELDEAEILPPPPGRTSRADDPVTGAISCDGGFVALLDVERLCRMRAQEVRR